MKRSLKSLINEHSAFSMSNVEVCLPTHCSMRARSLVFGVLFLGFRRYSGVTGAEGASAEVSPGCSSGCPLCETGMFARSFASFLQVI